MRAVAGILTAILPQRRLPQRRCYKQDRNNFKNLHWIEHSQVCRRSKKAQPNNRKKNEFKQFPDLKCQRVKSSAMRYFSGCVHFRRPPSFLPPSLLPFPLNDSQVKRRAKSAETWMYQNQGQDTYFCQQSWHGWSKVSNVKVKWLRLTNDLRTGHGWMRQNLKECGWGWRWKHWRRSWWRGGHVNDEERECSLLIGKDFDIDD